MSFFKAAMLNLLHQLEKKSLDFFPKKIILNDLTSIKNFSSNLDIGICTELQDNEIITWESPMKIYIIYLQ